MAITADISIHAPREGSDLNFATDTFSSSVFQSTLPVKGATTGYIMASESLLIFQSTLPVKGATCGSRLNRAGWRDISIHAPREGSD